MGTFEIRKGVFAMGKIGARALSVVKRKGDGFVGVRGQRPVLEAGRFPTARTSKALLAALKGE